MAIRLRWILLVLEVKQLRWRILMRSLVSKVSRNGYRALDVKAIRIWCPIFRPR
jgi:hypothetical protein